MTETKLDVFEKALREWDDLVHSCGLQGEESQGVCEFDPILIKYRKEYAAALPDNLPTLPRIIGEYLKDSKLAHNGISFLFQVGNHAMSGYRIAFENWAFTGKSFDEYEKGDTFARAWVLGVWAVEETGEIVKVEVKD